MYSLCIFWIPMPILKPLTTEAKRGIPCDNYEINKEYGTARPGSLMLIVGCHMPLVLLTPSMIIFQLHCQMYLSKFQSISPLMSYLCLVKIFFISMLINIFIVYTISQEFSQSCYSPEIADIIEFTWRWTPYNTQKWKWNTDCWGNMFGDPPRLV